MKIHNEKNEFNKCYFLDQAHNLFNISIIFFDISIKFFDISAISNDIFSNFLQIFVFNEVQFFKNSFDCICFEHSKFVHRIKHIIYIN
jgi:hypothetical protein